MRPRTGGHRPHRLGLPAAPRRAGDRGAVTAELAVGLVAATAGLALVLSVGAAGAAQVRVQLGAGAAARALARGEDPARALTAARAVAGDGARVSSAAQGDLVRVVVTAPVHLLVPGAPQRVSASAVLRPEQLAGGGSR